MKSMNLELATAVVFDYVSGAFAGVFRDVYAGGRDGFLWKDLKRYEAKNLDYFTDCFETMMFCDQLIRVVEMIDLYVTENALVNKDDIYVNSSDYIKALCLNFKAEMVIYSDGASYQYSSIDPDDVNRLCSADITSPTEYITDAFWKENFEMEDSPYSIDLEAVKKFMSERRYYNYPYIEKNSLVDIGSKKLEEKGVIDGFISDENGVATQTQSSNSVMPSRALTCVNVTLKIAKYEVGGKSIASFHPEYSGTKYITPFLFNGLTIAMENTKKPQIWVRVSDLNYMPRSIQYTLYDATTRSATPYGRNSNLKAIKELALDKVAKFKISSLDDVDVILSCLI